MKRRIRLRHSRLKNLIRRRRISQNRWAQKLGLGRAHLSLLVNGKRPYPSRETRLKLLRGLDVDFDELFELEPSLPQHLDPTDRRRKEPPATAQVSDSGERSMHEFIQNLRFALRSLHRQPTFSVAALLILALGIGATSTMLSVVDATMLQALPFQEPDQLVMIWEHHKPTDTQRNPVSPANFIFWSEQSESFRDLAAFFPMPLNVTGTSRPLRVATGIATWNFFEILGKPPTVGGGFDPSDENQVVLSHSFWTQHFGRRKDLENLRLDLEGRDAQVVGVMPPDFDLPPNVDLWAKMIMTPRHRTFQGRYMAVLGRLAGGTTLEEARGEMSALANRLASQQPDTHEGWGVQILPLHEALLGSYRAMLLVLLASVGLVLLIGCVNLSGLQLTRNSSRLQELSIRAALGARRWVLVRQLLTETLIIGLLGGLLGLLLAALTLRWLPSWIAFDLPEFLELDLRLWTALVTLGISCLTGLLFGLLPAFQLTRTNLNRRLLEGSQRTTGAGSERVRGWMISTQIAIAIVLLVGAGLLLRSFHSLQSVDPGFDVEGLYSVELSRARLAESDPTAQSRFFMDVVEELSGVPGIDRAGGISWLPLGGAGSSTSFHPLDRPPLSPSAQPHAAVRIVTPGYFETAGMELLAGRYLDGSLEREDAPRRVIVNSSLVEQFWPDESPLGKKISMDWGAPIEGEIIGVVNDARLSSLDVAGGPTLYWSVRQIPNASMSVLVRSDLHPQALGATIRSVVSGIDPSQPVSQIVAMSDVLSRSLQPRRFPLLLLSAFALAAIALAALGLYGLISYGVVRRTGEIGLRMAFGADPKAVLVLLLRQGSKWVLAGSVAGLALAMALSRYLESLVYSISVVDPWTYVSVAVLVFLVSLAAILIPARRAMSIDPVKALGT